MTFNSLQVIFQRQASLHEKCSATIHEIPTRWKKILAYAQQSLEQKNSLPFYKLDHH